MAKEEKMRELSLFSGCGGGLLGSILLGWTPVGYVEINEYCQKIIAARIKDGYLPEAPIFTDIRAFNNQGYAEAYQGMVDVITAGFPCQSWSTAARGRNNSKRDIWPETMQAIDVIRPRAVLLENVSRKAIRRARFQLEATGFSCRGARISAAAVGAFHRRPREWLYADTNGNSQPYGALYEEVEILRRVSRLDAWEEDISRTLGMDDGHSNRMDRNKAIGNGQVPAVVKAVWELLVKED